MISSIPRQMDTPKISNETLFLRLLLQAEQAVNLMWQISQTISGDPAKILMSPSIPVYSLATKLVVLLKQNARLAPNPALSERMIQMSHEVQRCVNLFFGIIKNSIEIMRITYLMHPVSASVRTLHSPLPGSERKVSEDNKKI